MEQITTEQLFAELGSLHMAVKVARAQRDELQREVEALRAALVDLAPTPRPADGALDLAQGVPSSQTT